MYELCIMILNDNICEIEKEIETCRYTYFNLVNSLLLYLLIEK